MSIITIARRTPYYHVYNYSSSYEELLKKPNRPTLYVQRLRSMLSIVYKSPMNQGPIYVQDLQDLLVISEHSKSNRYLPLFSCNLKLKGIVLFTNLASTGIYRIIVIRTLLP